MVRALRRRERRPGRLVEGRRLEWHEGASPLVARDRLDLQAADEGRDTDAVTGVTTWS